MEASHKTIKEPQVILGKQSEGDKEEVLTPDEQFRGKRGVDRLTEEEVKDYFKDHLPISKP